MIGAGDASAPVGSGNGTGRRLLLGELLVQAKVITQEQLADVLGAPREPGKKIGQLLIERGWLSEAQLTQTLSLQLSVPWVSLYHIDFSRQLLNRVARELAERYCLIPIFVRHVKGQGETLYVAMDDPTNEAALVEVSRQAALPAKPMIASASDIRSAIRVYYGEPEVLDVPLPTRDPKALASSQAAPVESGAATQPDPPKAIPSQPPPPPLRPSRPPPSRRGASQPPPALPRQRAMPSQDSQESDEAAPLTTRSSPPPSSVVGSAAGAAAPPPPSSRGRVRPRPEAGSAEAGAGVRDARRGAKMLALTLLDGTTINLPSRPKGKEAFASQDGLTARDFVTALRAASQGTDASAVLGESPQWEPVVAALLSILLRKGLIADWEFVEELRKI